MATKKTKKSNSKKSRLNSAKKIQEQKNQRNRMRTVILFSLAVFLISLAFVKGQSAWLFLHNVIFGLTGIFAYFVGVIVFILALMLAYGRRPGGVQVLFILLLSFSLCGAFLIFGRVDISQLTFIDSIKVLYNAGVDRRGGGVASTLIGMPLQLLFGRPGADITVILLIFISLMAVTGKGIVDIVEAIRQPVSEKISKKKEEKALLDEYKDEIGEEQKPEKPKIDIPLFPRRSKIDIPLSSNETEKENVSAPTRSAIDIPLGPSVSDAEWAPSPGDEDDPLFKATIALLGEDEKKNEESNAIAEADKPLKPENAIIRNIFDEHEREKMQEKEIFAKFPLSPKEIDLDPETELLIDQAATDYEEKVKDVEEEKPKKKRTVYRPPSVSLLETDVAQTNVDVKGELRDTADFLVRTLESFGVKTRVVDISRGPTVTRFELQPSAGVRLSRITNLADDIALNLATAGVRIEAPIPNKAAVGIEVPNKQKRIVHLRPIIESPEFRRSDSPLTVALGRDISGKIMTTDIARMPHLLIAGTTGSGKSRCLHSMILSMIFKSSPEELRFVFIDPKMVEFGIYNGIPHMLIPVVTDARKASGALGWAVGEMLKRYKAFAELRVRDITSFNKVVENWELQGMVDEEGEEIEKPEKMARIVIIIDELADLMMASPREVEDSICRLAQMARAAGIHLIVATQRPSVDVITGVIKANISSRIALSVSSQVDSRTIIDSAGAEKLIGTGDMLFLPLDFSKPVRIQGCFASDEEIDRVVRELKRNVALEYDEEVLAEIERQAAAKDKGSNSGGSNDDNDKDSMFTTAVELVVESGQASTSLLQRRLKLGYSRAARIMDEMEDMGIIGPPEGSKPRTVNMTMQQLREMQLNGEM